MQTICVIVPSPTARAALAAGLRQEFAVLEGDTLSQGIVGTGAGLVVVAAEALSRDRLEEAPFASLPFLILGDFPWPGNGRRTAPVGILGRDATVAEVVEHARTILNRSSDVGSTAPPPDQGPPFVPAGTVDRVRRLAAAHRILLPVLFAGESGTGKRSAARTLHAAAGLGSLVRLTPLTAGAFFEADAAAALAPSQGPVTLLADGVERLPGTAQAALVDCLAVGSLQPVGVSRPFWLLATTTADLVALAEIGGFDAALAAGLSALVIVLPPLRSRPHDIEPIAGAVLSELGRAVGRSFALAPGALERLRRHRWPGNVAELLAVLRRSALLAGTDVIREHELSFSADAEIGGAAPGHGHQDGDGDASLATAAPGPEPAVSPEPAVGPAPAPEPSPAVTPNASLELILTQLAHELKNPMVTIKTFAQHLPALLEDAELRQRFATLADEAIDRMDNLLDNVLDFARLGTPRPDRVSLPRLVDGALESVADRLAARNVQVHREGWDQPRAVLADEAQVTYAFRNLFDSVVSELALERELRVELGPAGTVCVRFAGSGGVAAKLQSFLEDGLGVPAASAFPLRVALARAVIAHNGGHVVVEAGAANETRITITLRATPAA